MNELNKLSDDLKVFMKNSSSVASGTLKRQLHVARESLIGRI
jgi:hypothetical protein